MDIMTNHKCNACGGNVKFNPVSQTLVCEHCSSEYTDLEQKKKTQSDNQMYNNFECVSCGAKLVADKLSMASVCAFCGSNVVLNNQAQSHFQPDYILPFLVDKEKAMDLFRELCKRERKTPKEISTKSKVSKMQGVYVPVCLFSANTESRMQYECAQEKQILTSTSRVFDVFNVAMRIFGSFNKIPVNASSYFNSKFIESIEPFDYNKLTQFDNKYLLGFFADCSDVSATQCFKTADKRMLESISAISKGTIKGFTKVEMKDSKMNYSNLEQITALVPVWFLNITYKNKKYCFTINGQTGKIAGVLPMSDFTKRLLHAVRTMVIAGVVAVLSLLTAPIISIIALVAGAVYTVISFRNSSAANEQVYHLDGAVNADEYIVQNSINISENTATFTHEKKVAVSSE